MGGIQMGKPKLTAFLVNTGRKLGPDVSYLS